PIIRVTAAVAVKMPVPFVLDDNAPTRDPTTGICTGGASALSNPPSATEGYQASNFACLDGMLIAMNDAVVIGATFGSHSDGVHTGTPSAFSTMLSSQLPAPFRGPGAIYPGIADATHPDIPVWSGEPEVIDVFYGGLGFDAGSDDGSANPAPPDFIY